MPLHQQDWEPSGAPRARLVVVHGFGEHAGMDAYAWFARRLVSAGYAAHAFDQRGHGRSPGRRGYVASWDDYRVDVDDAARRAHARGDAPVVLVGVSLGGLGILEYLVMRPDAPVIGAAAIGGVLGPVGASPVQLALGRIASRVWPTMPIDPKLDLTNLSRDQAAAAAFAGDPLFHQQATASTSRPPRAARPSSCAPATGCERGWTRSACPCSCSTARTTASRCSTAHSSRGWARTRRCTSIRAPGISS